MTVVGYIGALLFGLVVGWVTSRLLARRAGSAHVSHIAAVIALVGGGWVAIQPGDRGLFGMFGIGLFAGFLAYVAVFHRLNKDQRKTANLMGVDNAD